MENFKLRLDQILKDFGYTTFKPSGVHTVQTANYARSNNNAGLRNAFASILADLKEANAEARNKYDARKAEILAALKELGIQTTEQVGRKMTVTNKEWYSLMMEDAMKGYNREAAYSYYVIETIRRIEKELTDGEYYQAHLDRKAQEAAAIEPKKTALLSYLAAVLSKDAYAVLMSMKPSLEQIEELAKEHKMTRDYGTTIDCDACDECGAWTIGERRCDCGNRRISAEAGVNYVKVGSGFTISMYISTEAY